MIRKQTYRKHQWHRNVLSLVLHLRGPAADSADISRSLGTNREDLVGDLDDVLLELGRTASLDLQTRGYKVEVDIEVDR